MTENRIIICGGGTAGHIYPGLAVSRRMLQKDNTLRFTFVGGGRPLEKKIMKHHGLDFIPLKIEGLKGRGLKIIRSLLLLPGALWETFRVLRKLRPRLVIGVGGYSSGPMVFLAALKKIPTLILEQNLYPGLTNRLLIPWVDRAVVSFRGSLPHFKGKGVFIGNPVREEFYHLPAKTRNHRLSLLVFGGSQGSLFLNRALVASIDRLKEERDRLKIFHQTGPGDYRWVKEAYEKSTFGEAEIAPYFFDMAEYFRKADLVVSRAGASTIAELIAARKAALLVPFARATDNHQLLNARELEKIRGAEILREEEFTPQRFADRIYGFMKNKEKIDHMENNLRNLDTVDAAERIADLSFELMKKSSREA